MEGPFQPSLISFKRASRHPEELLYLLGSFLRRNCNDPGFEPIRWHGQFCLIQETGEHSHSELRSRVLRGKSRYIAWLQEARTRARKHLLSSGISRGSDAQTLSFSLHRFSSDRCGGNVRSGLFLVHNSRRDRHLGRRSIAPRHMDLPNGACGKHHRLFG